MTLLQIVMVDLVGVGNAAMAQGCAQSFSTITALTTNPLAGIYDRVNY